MKSSSGEASIAWRGESKRRRKWRRRRKYQKSGINGENNQAMERKVSMVSWRSVKRNSINKRQIKQ